MFAIVQAGTARFLHRLLGKLQTGKWQEQLAVWHSGYITAFEKERERKQRRVVNGDARREAGTRESIHGAMDNSYSMGAVLGRMQSYSLLEHFTVTVL